MKRVKVRWRFALTAAVWAAVLVLAGAAGAAAQATPPVVSVSDVTSDEFPSVSALVTVTDPAGNSIAGLTAADFQVIEDANAISASNFSIETIEGEPLSVVLALDVSVQWQQFAAVQAAADALVEALGPRDQMAIIAFSETVKTAQEFTADKEALKNSIGALIATGQTTALNEAALQAVNLAAKGPTSERAVIVVTNSGNNTGSASAREVMDAATAAALPIHTLGYGANAATDSLKAMSDATGGQSLDLPDATAVEEALPALGGSLREITYKVSFYSALKADNQAHPFTVAVTHDGATGEATSSFTAASSAAACRSSSWAARQRTLSSAGA